MMTRQEKIAETMQKKYAKKVMKLSLSGSFICSYPSVNAAARENGLPPTNISQCCKKNLKGKVMHTLGGYCWQFV